MQLNLFCFRSAKFRRNDKTGVKQTEEEQGN